MGEETDDFPGGIKFLEFIVGLQAKVASETFEAAPRMGKKLPKAIEAMGSVLAYLDGLATCLWGCSNGDHKVEYLVGRAVSISYSAILLTFSGQYDEALALIRVVGEITNLMALFTAEPASFEDWKTMSEKDRRKAFAPYKVRERVAATQIPLVVEDERYGLLSSQIHVSPEGKPQSHSDDNRPRTVPRLQDTGLFKFVNELARCVALLPVFATQLIKCPNDIRGKIRKHARELAKNVGSVDITMKGSPWIQAP
jgi:hypothetical protein